MNIDIEKPLQLLLEITYITGLLVDRKIPDLISVNELVNKLIEIYKEK